MFHNFTVNQISKVPIYLLWLASVSVLKCDCGAVKIETFNVIYLIILNASMRKMWLVNFVFLS